MKAMTDERARELVEALRELARRRETYSIEAGQAADEIERLRAEVRTLNARLASGGLVDNNRAHTTASMFASDGEYLG